MPSIRSRRPSWTFWMLGLSPMACSCFLPLLHEAQMLAGCIELKLDSIRFAEGFLRVFWGSARFSKNQEWQNLRIQWFSILRNVERKGKHEWLSCSMIFTRQCQRRLKRSGSVSICEGYILDMMRIMRLIFNGRRFERCTPKRPTPGQKRCRETVSRKGPALKLGARLELLR